MRWGRAMRRNLHDVESARCAAICTICRKQIPISLRQIVDSAAWITSLTLGDVVASARGRGEAPPRLRL